MKPISLPCLCWPKTPSIELSRMEGIFHTALTKGPTGVSAREHYSDLPLHVCRLSALAPATPTKTKDSLRRQGTFFMRCCYATHELTFTALTRGIVSCIRNSCYDRFIAYTQAVESSHPATTQDHRGRSHSRFEARTWPCLPMLQWGVMPATVWTTRPNRPEKIRMKAFAG